MPIAGLDLELIVVLDFFVVSEPLDGRTRVASKRYLEDNVLSLLKDSCVLEALRKVDLWWRCKESRTVRI